MRKLVTIFLITICLVTSSSFSQQDDSASNEKQKFCSVKLIKTNGTIDMFILGGFTSDSIWGYSYKERNNKKIIQQDQAFATGSSDIHKVFIRIDKGVLVTEKTKRIDSIDIKRFNSALFAQNTKTAFLDMVLFLDASFLAIDLLFPRKGKWYRINGDEKKFGKMAKDFVSKKSN